MRRAPQHFVPIVLLGSLAFAIPSGAATRSPLPGRFVVDHPVRKASFTVPQETLLHGFRDGRAGAYPHTALTAGRHGELYGTTLLCGSKHCESASSTSGRGIVFKLSPTGSRYQVLFRFDSERGHDGDSPSALITDQTGALYGTARSGGGQTPACPFGCGTVFKLTRVELHFVDSVLHHFRGGHDGDGPDAGVIADKTGALYGTTATGGNSPACVDSGRILGCGTVFKLTPAGSSYTESVLYRFQGASDGALPVASLISDGPAPSTARPHTAAEAVLRGARATFRGAGSCST